MSASRPAWALVLPVASLLATLALALAALQAHSQHRRAAEQALRDFASVAGTEFVRRTAFDVGFNGYQAIADALRRSAQTGPPRLPSAESELAGLASRLFSVEPGRARVLQGAQASPELEGWVAAQGARIDAARPALTFCHRSFRGQAQTVVFVPQVGGSLLAFQADPAGLEPFARRALARGPLLPAVVGDGRVGNRGLSLAFLDHAGRVRLASGPGDARQVEVPFGDFFRGVLQGSVVRLSLDPELVPHLVVGGVPSPWWPGLGALAALSAGLTVLSGLQSRRERALLRLRDDFVAGVSHELRTPLAQIRLFTETVLLRRHRSEEQAQQFLEAAHREALRMGHLVDNLLEFSRAERGLRDVATSPQPLAPLVQDVVEGFQPLAAPRGVRLLTDLDAEVQASVDPAALRQVLLNLLDNALKYGPRDAEVRVALRQTREGARLTVEDHGPGVPPADRDRIFAAFHRLDRDRNGATAGVGLGLAVVRDLLSRQGGECRVEERPGGGARFVVGLCGRPA